MNNLLPVVKTKIIIDKAKEYGASLAGICDADTLRRTSSHKSDPKVKLPPDSLALIVLALEHPESEPRLDYWDGKPGRTDGVRKLNESGKKLKIWLQNEFQIDARVLSYSVDRGGIFLKDAAALAGIGVIGKNNLLITRKFGPRVRLSAVSLTKKLPQTGPLEFSPCEGCDRPCLSACPQNAFVEGSYSNSRCRIQMNLDEKNAVKNILNGFFIKYCRECEIACPVGKKNSK